MSMEAIIRRSDLVDPYRNRHGATQELHEARPIISVPYISTQTKACVKSMFIHPWPNNTTDVSRNKVVSALYYK